MKKSLFSLLALSILSLVGSTYAATSGTDSVPSTDPTTVTVTTETSLTSESPITDVSVSNVVKQDGVAVSTTETSMPVDSIAVASTSSVDTVSEYERVSGLQDQQFNEFLSIFKTLLPIWIFTMIISLAGGIFWLVMFIDAIKYQKDNQLLWILVLLFVNIIGAIVYYFVEKHPRDKASKLASQTNPVTPPVNPETVVVQTPQSTPSSDQPVNPLA